MEKIKIAAIQMSTVADKMENVRTVKAYLEKIKDENPDFVILPERCSVAHIRQRIFQSMPKKKVDRYGSSYLGMQNSMEFI